MLISLATLLLLRSVEYKNSRDNNGFILTFMTALFVYIVAEKARPTMTKLRDKLQEKLTAEIEVELHFMSPNG